MSDPFEHIDEYINKKLSDADRSAFELAMQEDSKLQIAVKEYDHIKKIGLAFLEDEVRAALIESKVDTQESTTSKSKWLLLAIIVIVTLISAGLYKYHQAKKLKERELYVMRDYTPPQVVFTRGESSLDTSAFNKAKEAFSVKDYEACLSLLNTIEPSLRDDQYYWLLGHTLFIKREFYLSKNAFSKVSSTDEKYSDAKIMEAKIHEVMQVLY